MFHGKDPLNSHLQTHDPNKQALQCDECGKHYNTRLGLRRHVATHAASAPGGDLTCKVCRQTFESMPALLEHLSTHTGRPPPGLGGGGVGGAVRERKHPCDRCDRRFFTRKDVRRHAVVHTGRRDFLCPRCAQRFGRRDHLTRHLKKSHAQEAAPMPPGGVKEEPGAALCAHAGPDKDPGEASFPMGMFNPHALPSASTSGLRHHHPMVPGPLSASLGVGCHAELHKHQQQQPQYLQPARYPPGSTTSYLKTEMENFLAELQCGPLPPQAAASSSSSRPGDMLPDGLGQDPHFPLRNSAFAASEPSGAAGMDLSHLLGFLPFGLPPYSTPLSSAGLVMAGYSTSTTTATSASPSSQAPGPLTSFQPPQPHEPPQVSGLLNQLPPVFSPGFSSPTLPRFHQAFPQ